MGAGAFEVALRGAGYSAERIVWFVRWQARFAEFLGDRGLSTDEVDESVVILFLRSLLNRGVPAWQRHQGAMAIRLYFKQVVGQPVQGIEAIVQTLDQIAAREAAASGSDKDFADFIGLIAPSEPAVLQKVH